MKAAYIPVRMYVGKDTQWCKIYELGERSMFTSSKAWRRTQDPGTRCRTRDPF